MTISDDQRLAWESANLTGEPMEEAPSAGALGLCGPEGTEGACAPDCCKEEETPAAPDPRFLVALQACADALSQQKTLLVIDPSTSAEKIQLAQRILAEANESILMEAERIVNGARRGTYGTPENNFGRIADLWTAYLNGKPSGPLPITPQDTDLMMILLKVARLIETPVHRDSAVDIAGYAACLETLWANQAATAAKLADEL